MNKNLTVRRFRGGEAGFTLVELFVVLATIGILAGLSIETFRVYKESSYVSYADRYIVDAQTALAAGISDMSEDAAGAFYAAWTNADGSMGGAPDSSFVPGLVTTDSVRVSINYDSLCDSTDTDTWCPAGGLCCVTQWYRAYHCKGSTMKTLTRWNNGVVTELTANSAGC